MNIAKFLAVTVGAFVAAGVLAASACGSPEAGDAALAEEGVQEDPCAALVRQSCGDNAECADSATCHGAVYTQERQPDLCFTRLQDGTNYPSCAARAGTVTGAFPDAGPGVCDDLVDRCCAGTSCLEADACVLALDLRTVGDTRVCVQALADETTFPACIPGQDNGSGNRQDGGP